MAAAGWNQETKGRLSEKVAVNMNDLASLTKHVLRGSKSSDVSKRLVTSSSFNTRVTLEVIIIKAMSYFSSMM